MAEPVGELRKVPIRECGEPLVDFLQRCPRLLLDRPRFHYRRETLVRERVAEMLCRAETLLPAGLRLALIEGWRPPLIQRRMYMAVERQIRRRYPDWSEHRIRRAVNRFSAPMDKKAPPPHTTGGAVDLMLAHEHGKLLDHSSPFDTYDPEGFAFDAPGLSPVARQTRDTLARALEEAGLTNYPSEYWHWSYGDQGWAYRGHHAHALYGAVQPPDWKPDPADESDDPLEFVDMPQ
jgi:zinc D-Ala-D-Ala dipeptidase